MDSSGCLLLGFNKGSWVHVNQYHSSSHGTMAIITNHFWGPATKEETHKAKYVSKDYWTTGIEAESVSDGQDAPRHLQLVLLAAATGRCHAPSFAVFPDVEWTHMAMLVWIKRRLFLARAIPGDDDRGKMGQGVVAHLMTIVTEIGQQRVRGWCKMGVMIPLVEEYDEDEAHHRLSKSSPKYESNDAKSNIKQKWSYQILWFSIATCVRRQKEANRMQIPCGSSDQVYIENLISTLRCTWHHNSSV